MKIGDVIIHSTNSPVFFEWIKDEKIRTPAWFSLPNSDVSLISRLGTKHHSQISDFKRLLYYQFIDTPNLKTITNLREEVKRLQLLDVIPSSLISSNRASIIDRFPNNRDKIIEYYTDQKYDGVYESYDGVAMVCLFNVDIITLVRVSEFSEFYRTVNWLYCIGKNSYELVRYLRSLDVLPESKICYYRNVLFVYFGEQLDNKVYDRSLIHIILFPDFKFINKDGLQSTHSRPTCDGNSWSSNRSKNEIHK